jgi:hypothetical protein
MTKDIEGQSNQLNLTVVALVALVAIVGLVALVLYTANVATGPKLAYAGDESSIGAAGRAGTENAAADQNVTGDALHYNKIKWS